MGARKPRDGYEGARRWLRTIGPIVLAVGVLLLAVGLIDFFAAFGGQGPPKLFWMAFVGILLTGVGGVMTGAGYRRELINYEARQARPGVRDLTSAVREGWDGGDTPRCPECGEPVKESDRFCDRCGRSLAEPRACPCGQRNDADARFCSACGAALGL